MRFMVSCEENNCQSRDRHCHPQKRHVQPPQPNLLPAPTAAPPPNVTLCFSSRGEKGRSSSGPGALQDPQERRFSNQKRSSGDIWP